MYYARELRFYIQKVTDTAAEVREFPSPFLSLYFVVTIFMSIQTKSEN